MRLSRSSLCGILLDNGEEDLAVLIAQADLPEILDPARDAPALAVLGLDEAELRALLPAVSGDPLAAATPPESARMSQTISDRWAHLVSVWTGTGDGTHA
jgi:hypothetical protein